MSQKFRDIKTKMIVKKKDNMSLIFRDVVNKRGKNEGMDYPSLQGCNALGTHRPRDASSKGRIVQGMHNPRDASSRDASSRDA
jgi:hypothetical protein